jgi:hypothetical protein
VLRVSQRTKRFDGSTIEPARAILSVDERKHEMKVFHGVFSEIPALKRAMKRFGNAAFDTLQVVQLNQAGVIVLARRPHHLPAQQGGYNVYQ